MADNNDRLPHRDSWMDVLQLKAKNAEIFVDPIVKAKSQYGYSFDSRLSQKAFSVFASPTVQPMLFDSINLGKNASDPFISLPKPGRHYGKNNVGFLDGHVRSRRME